MILYNSNTQELSEIPIVYNGDRYTCPMPSKGIYEYIKPEIDIELETLGQIIIVDDIATNEVIPFPEWKLIDYPVRIMVREKFLRSGKKFAGIAFDVLLDNLGANSERVVKYGKRYKRVYLRQLESENNNPKSDVYFTLNSETGEITPSDSDIILEQIRFDFREVEFDETNILICS